MQTVRQGGLASAHGHEFVDVLAITSREGRFAIGCADVEAEAILGDLLKHGQSHQMKTPLLQAASVRLRIYQNSRSTS